MLYIIYIHIYFGVLSCTSLCHLVVSCTFQTYMVAFVVNHTNIEAAATNCTLADWDTFPSIVYPNFRILGNPLLE